MILSGLVVNKYVTIKHCAQLSIRCPMRQRCHKGEGATARQVINANVESRYESNPCRVE